MASHIGTKKEWRGRGPTPEEPSNEQVVALVKRKDIVRKIISLLLEKGASPFGKKLEDSAWMKAVITGDADLVKEIFVKARIDVNAKQPEGYTPLGYATFADRRSESPVKDDKLRFRIVSSYLK